MKMYVGMMVAGRAPHEPTWQGYARQPLEHLTFAPRLDGELLAVESCDDLRFTIPEPCVIVGMALYDTDDLDDHHVRWTFPLHINVWLPPNVLRVLIGQIHLGAVTNMQEDGIMALPLEADAES